MTEPRSNIHELVKGQGPLRGVVRWLVAPPPDPKVLVVDRITSFISRLTMLGLVVVVLITFYEVVMRYVFRSPTLWVNETTQWIGAVMFLVSGMYAMQRRSHIRITAVYDIVPDRVKALFETVTLLVILGYALIFIVPSVEVAWKALLIPERTGSYWNPPIPGTIKPLCLVVTFFVAVQAVNNYVVDVIRGQGKRHTTEDPPEMGVD